MVIRIPDERISKIISHRFEAGRLINIGYRLPKSLIGGNHPRYRLIWPSQVHSTIGQWVGWCN
jgi:hypothetical protein